METSLKPGFAQIFSCCPKNLSCPKFGGAAAPLAPPARTPMVARLYSYLLILVLLLGQRYLSHKTKFKHEKTKSEYVPFYNFRRIGDNPNEMEQRPLAVSIRDRLILRKLAFKNSIKKTVHYQYIKLCPQFTTDTCNY